MIGVFAAWRIKSCLNQQINIFNSEDNTDFIGRQKELSILSNIWQNNSCHVFILTGMGGMGKTSLLQAWLAQMESANWQEAEQVFAWSFPEVSRYQQAQQAMQDFVCQALKWFGADMALPTRLVERVNLLARLIQRRRTLLVLDNVSPLYFSAQTEHQLLGVLLNQLAAYNPGLCLLASRKSVEVDPTFQQWIMQRELLPLSDADGALLLQKYGVKATTGQLQRIARSFGGAPLSLRLLGSYLADAYGGSPAHLDSIPIWPDLEQEGFHVRRILSVIEHWLGTSPDLILLYLLSLMDSPATKQELFLLLGSCNQPWFIRWVRPDEGLRIVAPLAQVSVREYTKIQRRLFRLHLISSPLAANTLDTHRLIRAYFRQQAAVRFPVMRERFLTLLQECAHKGETVFIPESTMNAQPLQHTLPDIPTAEQTISTLSEKLDQSAKHKHWYRAAILAYHLSEHHLVLGNIPAAILCARRSVAYAELSRDHGSLLQNLKMLTKLLRLTGRATEAVNLVLRAERSTQSLLPQLAA